MGTCLGTVSPADQGSAVGQATFQESLLQHQSAEDEYKYLSEITHFDQETLRLLYKRFCDIDGSIERDSRISLAEFAKIISMPADSILVFRFFKYMDVHSLGLTFRIFACTMSILSRSASEMEKMKLSFSLYDQNDDGFIDKKEFINIITDCIDQLSPLSLDTVQIEQIAENTLECIRSQRSVPGDGVQDGAESANTDPDRISFDEYCRFVSQPENKRLLAPFSLDIAQLIKYESESRRLVRLNTMDMDPKTLHHGPLSVENRKFRAFLPSVHFGDKIERVQSIHNAMEICNEFSARNPKGTEVKTRAVTV